MDAAWVTSRDKVFKKKRNSIVNKGALSSRGGSEAPLKANDLEEIDEIDECSKIIVEEVETTPLKNDDASSPKP